MTDIQAAIGLVQLGKLDQFIEERDRGARFYRDALSDLPWLRQVLMRRTQRRLIGPQHGGMERSRALTWEGPTSSTPQA